MDETFTKTFDDLEYKAGRKIEGNNKVEVEVTGLGRIQLDLNDANLGTLQESVKPFFDAGTKVTAKGAGSAGSASTRKSTTRKPGAATTKKAAPSTADEKFNAAAREWAQANLPEDEQPSDRGRLSNKVIAKYKEANPNWERDFYLNQADDSAPNAPAPVEEEPVVGGQAAPPQQLDEHGWEREPDTSFAGVAPQGSYS